LTPVLDATYTYAAVLSRRVAVIALVLALAAVAGAQGPPPAVRSPEVHADRRVTGNKAKSQIDVYSRGRGIIVVESSVKSAKAIDTVIAGATSEFLRRIGCIIGTCDRIVERGSGNRTERLLSASLILAKRHSRTSSDLYACTVQNRMA